MNSDGDSCYPGLELLASEMGYRGTSQVKRGIEELVEGGYIERTPGPGKKGGQGGRRSNSYRARFPSRARGAVGSSCGERSEEIPFVRPEDQPQDEQAPRGRGRDVADARLEADDALDAGRGWMLVRDVNDWIDEIGADRLTGEQETLVHNRHQENQGAAETWFHRCRGMGMSVGYFLSSLRAGWYLEYCGGESPEARAAVGDPSEPFVPF
jgi:hypothetical protein